MDRIFITPLANKLASLNSINLGNVKGTGPRGRIIKVDIEKHLGGHSYSPKTEHQDQAEQRTDIAYEKIDIPKIPEDNRAKTNTFKVINTSLLFTTKCKSGRLD